jgi:cysteine-rich repeat protein
VTVLVLPWAALVHEPAHGAKSQVRAARECRRAVAGALEKLIGLGFHEIDRCHRAATSRSVGRDCNVLRPGEPRATTYRRWEYRTNATVLDRCGLDNPARITFPPRQFQVGQDLVVKGDPTKVVPEVETLLEASARDLDALTAGAPTALPAATAPASACIAAVEAARSMVVRDVLRRAIRCQRARDARSSEVTPLDPSCEPLPADAVVRRAAGRIAGACGAVDGTEMGTCAPLPECVIEAGATTGVALARLSYGQCGNGVLDPGEDCDDGNTQTDDGCGQCLAPECGNGRVESGEECDDGNKVDHDTCTACRAPICGDGEIDVGAEACDDGNTIPFDGCTDCQSDPVACSSAGVLATVTVDFDEDGFVPVAGWRVRVGYDPAVVTIPGSLVSTAIAQRVRNLTGVGMSFTAADRDLQPSEEQPDGTDETLQTIAAISPGTIPPGPFEEIRFDCLGENARASQFSCSVSNVVDAFTNTVPDERTAEFVVCTITLETAPTQ